MVRSIKEEHGIKCRRHKRFKVTTDSNHYKMVYLNVLDQLFDAKRPDESWVSYITYIWTDEGCTWQALKTYILKRWSAMPSTNV
jgi:transposase InsO family protein